MATKIAYKPKIAKPPIKTKHNKRHRLDAKVLLWNVYGFSQKQQQKKKTKGKDENGNKIRNSIGYNDGITMLKACYCAHGLQAKWATFGIRGILEIGNWVSISFGGGRFIQNNDTN